jgi:micrococcal nuclease
MRNTAQVALLLTLALPGAGSAQLRDLVGVTFDARVVSVIDGDTVDAVPAGETRAIRIRLEGIDAPERGEAFSDRARTLARVLLLDQQVEIEGRNVDRYGRLVARLIAGGQDASLALVKAGLACHYTFYSSDPLLARAQAEAQLGGAGFWAAGASRPRCAVTDTPATATVTPPGAATPAPSAFRGNTSSLVYHAPSCPNYTCRNCTRAFASEAEARAAGFRPAGDCLQAPRR